MRLSPPQIRALRAAAIGKLMYARPVLSGGGYFIRASEKDPSGRTVRRTTGDALVARGLIVRPPMALGNWSSAPVAITPVGLAALNEADA